MHMPPPPPQEKRSFPWWGWAMVIGVPVLFCGGFVVFLGQMSGQFNSIVEDLGGVPTEEDGWPEYAANYAAICADDFQKDVGRYPTNAEGLNALLKEPAGVKGWDGPYAYDFFEDEWGNPVVYETTETGFRVISLGAHGKKGGKGEDADLIIERRNE